MYYTERLRITRSLICLAIVLAAIYALGFAIMAANGVLHVTHSLPSDAIPLPALFATSGFVAAIFGSRLGRALSEENESHLPVAWTKPVSRLRYALTIIGVDALGILAAFTMTLGSIIAAMVLIGVARFIDVTPDSGLQLARFLAFPLAFYGLIIGGTASLKKTGRGVVWGVWVGSFIVAALAAADFPRPWGSVVAAIDLINPFHYASYSHTSGGDTINIIGPATLLHPFAVSVDAAALATLCVAGLAAGLWQWQRLEA